MIIMGVDPGTLVTGFGVIRIQNAKLEALDFGCIRPPSAYRISDRYLVIFEGIEALLEKYKPDHIVVETQYVDKNVQSAIKLGMARGAVVIAAARKKVKIFEYAPTQAKLAVVGTGKASKAQVQGMVQALLNLSTPPEPEDASDALSLAICHTHFWHRESILAKEV